MARTRWQSRYCFRLKELSMVKNDDKSAAIQIGVIILMFIVVGVILVVVANIIA